MFNISNVQWFPCNLIKAQTLELVKGAYPATSLSQYQGRMYGLWALCTVAHTVHLQCICTFHQLPFLDVNVPFLLAYQIFHPKYYHWNCRYQHVNVPEVNSTEKMLQPINIQVTRESESFLHFALFHLRCFINPRNVANNIIVLYWVIVCHTNQSLLLKSCSTSK